MTLLYSKHRVLNIADLLSVAKFMFPFANDEIPKHFDNYFTEIVAVHKYQTKRTSLQNDHLPRLKTSLGQLSLKCISSKL